jgi:hypothetical protein
MALKRLTNYEFFGVTGELCGDLRPRIAAHPPIAWNLTNLDIAHEIFSRRWIVEVDPLLIRLRQQAGRLDLRQDLEVRFAITFLEALALYSELIEPGSGEVWLAISKQLWPEGQAHNAKSWFEEGAHADATGHWLAGQPAVQQKLASILLPDGRTLLAVIEGWIATGRELLAVERQSQDRLRALSDQKQPSDLPRARSLVIQAIDGLRRYFAQDAAAPAGLATALLARVDELEARADRLRRKAPDPGADPSEPEVVEAEVVEVAPG